MSAEAITTSITPNSPEWLEERKKYLGASDAPACLGMSRYKSPVEVAMSKRPDYQPQEMNDAMRRGHDLEPVGAAMFERTTGIGCSDSAHCIHQEHSWMAATPDRILSGIGLLEIKTHVEWLADRYGEEMTDEVDESEWVQVQHQMAVTGADVTYLAVIFAPTSTLEIMARMMRSGASPEGVADLASEAVDFRIYKIERNDEFIQTLIEAERDFWERYVEGDEEPQDVRKVQPRGDIREATQDEDELTTAARAAYAKQKEGEREYKQLREELQDAIGTSQGIDTCEGVIKWGNPSKRTDWKAVAEALQPSVDPDDFRDLVETNTKATERRFTVPRSWSK